MFFYFWFGLFSSYLTAYLTLVYGLAFLGLLLPVVSSVLPRLVLVVRASGYGVRGCVTACVDAGILDFVGSAGLVGVGSALNVWFVLIVVLFKLFVLYELCVVVCCCG